MNVRLAVSGIVLIAACADPRREGDWSLNEDAGGTVNNDAGEGGRTLDCGARTTGRPQVGTSALYPPTPTNLGDAFRRGAIVLLARVGEGETLPGAFVHRSGPYEYCVDYWAAPIQDVRVLSGSFDGDLRSRIGYQLQCGRAFGPGGEEVGVECDTPPPGMRAESSQEYVLILSNATATRDGALEVHAIGWQFPLSTDDTVDLSNIGGTSMPLSEVEVLARAQ